MSWSLGETQALAVKAARGAGYSWGLAEEAGFAVRWLQAHTLPGVAALAGYLVWREHQEDNDALAACPLLLGAALSDEAAALAAELPREFPAVAFPLLLLPSAACVVEEADAGAPLTFDWEDAAFEICSGALTRFGGDAAILSRIAVCHLRQGPTGGASACPPATRVPEHAAQAIADLEDFAARTYAPANERSRLAGAGAGGNDQD